MTEPAGAPPDLDDLVEAARAARQAAYAPYSDYAVGAALRTEGGRLFQGCNVENAMYGAAVCAERVAILTAVAAGARRIAALAVVTEGGGTPCGFCRQVMAEFATPDLPVAIAGPEGPYRVRTLGQLLPEAFTAAALEAARGPEPS